MRVKNWRLTLMSIMVVLALTGCLRYAGGNLDDPESRVISSPTAPPTSQPTYTPYPTFTQPPAEAEAEAADVTDTPQTSALVLPTAQGNVGGVVAQEATLAPGFVEATSIVATVTQQAINATLTAQGPVVPLPTTTPTLNPVLPTSTPLPAQPGQDCYHQVKAGENLFRLSMRYGLTVQSLASANGISNIQLIIVGDSLRIPGCGTTGVTPPPTSVPVPTRGTVGDPSNLPTSVPSAGGIRHIIQEGETLFQIAQRYGVPMDVIASANNIVNPNLIIMTEELIIP